MPSAVSSSAELDSSTPATAGLNPIPTHIMPLVSPSTLLRAHLQQTPPVRPSGRSLRQAQPVDLNVGSLTHAHGSSVVKIGATTVVCGVRAEVVSVSDIPSYDPSFSSTSSSSLPDQHTPVSLYGLVVPNLELSTGCSPLFPANAAPGPQAQSLTQRLLTLLLTTRLVSHEDLAIDFVPSAETNADLSPDDPAWVSRERETKAFWVLYVDVWCISHGGESSVFDAAWLSLYAALRDVLLPRAWWDDDEKKVFCDPRCERGKALNLRSCPVPLGFAAFTTTKKETWVLVDPDAFEEQSCFEVGCVVVDLSPRRKEKRKTMVRLEKSGGDGAIGLADLRELVKCAEERWTQWHALLQKDLPTMTTSRKDMR